MFWKLNFKSISTLNKHFLYLQKKINRDNNIFLVWWSIRDILLWLDKNPKDIDVAMPWNPKKIYEKIKNNNDISSFITEKYWTITIIPKKNKKTQYEITPFRKEYQYTDNRHPDKITRTNDILSDVKRREFTISSIYYFLYINHNWKLNFFDKKKLSDKNIVNIYREYWFTYIIESNILIIQNENLIKNLLKWKFEIKNLFEIENLIKKTTKNDFSFNELKKIQIIIDPLKWINDLLEWKIKAVWNPDVRFKEDSLRIIRWLRFLNILNFKLWKKKNNKLKYFNIEKNTRISIKKNYFLIKNIAKERIKKELDKVFIWWNPFWIIALLDEINILKFLFPALYNTKNINQPTRYHPFDVYHHILLSLYFVQKISKNYLVRYAVLYHDVWKVDQYYLYSIWINKEEAQKVQELNHRNLSWELFKNDFKKLWFSNKEISEIKRYIDNHHKIDEFSKSKLSRQKNKIRQLLSEVWIEQTLNLFDVILWDRYWHFNPIQPPEIEEVYNMKKLIRLVYEEEWEFSYKKLAINWNDIIKRFNTKPSKKIWILLKKSFERVLKDIKTRNNKEIILSYLENTKKFDL